MRIRFIVGGEEREFAAEERESVMQVAVRNAVPGVIGECGGELSCATCHVYAAELPASMPPASADERDMLEAVDDLGPASRLSCQLRLRAECDGMTVVVPSR